MDENKHKMFGTNINFVKKLYITSKAGN